MPQFIYTVYVIFGLCCTQRNQFKQFKLTHTYMHTYIYAYILLDTYLCMCVRVYIHEPMTTRKNMCTFVCVYTLAGGDTLFEIPRESAGEREKRK